MSNQKVPSPVETKIYTREVLAVLFAYVFETLMRPPEALGPRMKGGRRDLMYARGMPSNQMVITLRPG